MARFSQLQMGVIKQMREKLSCVLTFFYVTVYDWLMIMSQCHSRCVKILIENQRLERTGVLGFGCKPNLYRFLASNTSNL